MSAAIATCYRHPDRETGVRCQRCERPICPECMVPAPVGVQCVECVRAARSRVVPARALLMNVPYVTYALIGANVAVWLVGTAIGLVGGGAAGVVNGGSLTVAGGLFGPAVAAGEWWRIFTAAFLHSGLLHVGLNMFALYIFGPPLERSMGRLRFSVTYLTSLVAGSLGALAVTPNGFTVGASGAIFGLMGAIVVGQRASGIDPRRSGIITVVVLNLVFTLVVPGISIGGHVGGLIGGLVAGSLLFNRGLRRRGGVAAVGACLGVTAACFVAALWVAANPLLR